MARVEILDSLKKEILKKFQEESKIIFKLTKSLEENHKKGKKLGNIGGIEIKEIKYKNFRFYFLTDGFKLRCLDSNKLINLLIRFIRMSDKKHQQKTIDEIKNILRIIGADSFK